MQYYQEHKDDPNILCHFLETKFVSKNKSLQFTFNHVFSNPTIDYDTVSSQRQQSWRQQSTLENSDFLDNYQILLDAIKSYQWNRVDSLFLEKYNTKEHFRLLFALLTKWHYSQKIISRLQYQTSLGIQQVRWAMSPDNKFLDNLNNTPYARYKHLGISFAKVKDLTKQEYNDLYRLSVDCYPFLQHKIVYKKAIKLFGMTEFTYGIPETYNISKCGPVYRPCLVLGSLKACTLLKFIKNYKERPFVCHHPDLKQNSTSFDTFENQNILEHWHHDYFHMLRGIRTGKQVLRQDLENQQQCLRMIDNGIMIHDSLDYQQQQQQQL